MYNNTVYCQPWQQGWNLHFWQWVQNGVPMRLWSVGMAGKKVYKVRTWCVNTSTPLHNFVDGISAICPFVLIPLLGFPLYVLQSCKRLHIPFLHHWHESQLIQANTERTKCHQQPCFTSAGGVWFDRSYSWFVRSWSLEAPHGTAKHRYGNCHVN